MNDIHYIVSKLENFNINIQKSGKTFSNEKRSSS